ncbi:MAG UNVERIFIED_CONTAM: CNNM domain-containing protein [Planctomycetaceae bacterium]|jgi:Mg2+/Co2+ transporter CorB
MIIISILIIVGLLAFSSLLSALETAIIGSSPGRIQRFKAEGNLKASVALNLLKVKDKVNNTLLLINSISNTTCTTFGASLFIGLYGEDLGTLLSSTVMSVLIILFAEVIPKAIAVIHAERITLAVAPFVDILIRVLHPVNIVLRMIVRGVCFIFRINMHPHYSGAEELRGIIEHHHEEGNVFKEDRDMLDGILDISALTVESIMVHRSKMQTIDASQPIKKIVSQALSTTHTRIPVYKGTKDNIIGILHIRNLLKSLHDHDFNYSKVSLNEFITEPWFIPENALVNQQLHEFKQRRTHFALVVDEYGELRGLVTLEDVLEEIVGPIDDEHDKPITFIEKIRKTIYNLWLNSNKRFKQRNELEFTR